MKSIHLFLFRTLLTSLIVTLVLTVVGLNTVMRSVVHKELDSALLIRARAMSALLEKEKNGWEIENLKAVKESFSRENEPGDFYEIREASGKLISRTTDIQAQFPPELSLSPAEVLSFPLRLADGHPGRGIRLLYTPVPSDEHEKDRSREQAVDASLSPAAKEPIHIFIARDITSQQQVFKKLLWISSVCCLAAIVLSTLMVRFWLQKGLLHLKVLANHAREVNAEGRMERFPTGNIPEEIHDISHCLNGMLERLEQSIQKERQFTDNVAHDLRSPVAELRAMVEVALRYPADAEENRSVLQEIHEVSMEMESLIDQLFATIRSEQHQFVIQKESFELTGLLETAVSEFTQAASQRSLQMLLHQPTKLTIFGDRTILKTIFRNLISNAVEYSTENTTIELSVTTEPQAVCITFANRTHRLEAADLQHMFDRFWRKDAARSSHRHHGLGLNLVKTYCELLGYAISAEMQNPERLLISIRIPV